MCRNGRTDLVQVVLLAASSNVILGSRHDDVWVFGFCLWCGEVCCLVEKQLASSFLFIRGVLRSETCSSPADVTYLGFETRCDLDDA